MASALSPEANEMMDEIRRNQQVDNRPVKPKIEMTPPMMLDYLEQTVRRLEQKIEDWNNTSSHKLTAWNVYGFDVRGTTWKNADKRIRKFQAQSSLQPGITLSQLKKERKRLQALVKKTTLAEKK